MTRPAATPPRRRLSTWIRLWRRRSREARSHHWRANATRPLRARRRAVRDRQDVRGASLRLALLGVIIGIAAAASVARLLQGLLYQTAAVNAGSYLAAASVVVLVALFAAFQPARRAARINPIIVLRDG